MITPRTQAAIAQLNHIHAGAMIAVRNSIYPPKKRGAPYCRDSPPPDLSFQKVTIIRWKCNLIKNPTFNTERLRRTPEQYTR